MRYGNILEEELKNKVAKDYFGAFDCTEIKGKVDFCVALKNKNEKQNRLDIESILWAEAKKGKSDLIKSIVQLILTIGRARTFDKHLPPAFLGAFDAEKIAFVPYNEILDILSLNDFNWNVTSSNHGTKEFKLIYNKVESLFENNSLTFLFGADDKEIREFVKANFVLGKSGTSKIRIDKNNFTIIFDKWLKVVRPTISFNWEAAKQNGIISGDFYLADLLSKDNRTLKESLSVVLEETNYKMNKYKDVYGAFTSSTVVFNDGQKAHLKFWNKYERPPDEEYWDYIIERRDLLVPQDIRERKGSFFTPQIWVQLSQKYIADVLGQDWQEEYYVWDCASGTGNLLAGLTNKYNIWASTLDKQDVDVINDRIKNGANLLSEHVFQFDFLNDDFTKLPSSLQKIINDPGERKKLVIYINPPYAEGDSRTGEGRKNIQNSKVHDKYQKDLGKASSELFAQFFIRIYREIHGCILAEFSKLKVLQAPNFLEFRKTFSPVLKKMFIVPADTFDNVKGQFPIGFFIWDTGEKEGLMCHITDVFERDGSPREIKKLHSYDGLKFISDWLEVNSRNISKEYIGHLASVGNDFQNQNTVFIDDVGRPRKKGGRHTMISAENLLVACIYYTVRRCIEATWLNDRDQFLFPNKEWEEDNEFQNDCFTYALFTNNIQSSYGTNHWIPFKEQEVNSREKFDSNFMTEFISGKLKRKPSIDLFSSKQTGQHTPLEFSRESKQVFSTGLSLWKYYHQKPECNVNASLYDIREYFQGRNESGKMNSRSEDTEYTMLITSLREALKILTQKIRPKVYQYGFLK